jgi:dTDP-glucose pyrophosphorylase
MKILVPVAGEVSYQEGNPYAYPKNMYEIKGKPLIEYVHSKLSSISGAEFVFVVKKQESERFHTDNVLTLLEPSCTVLYTEDSTAGAACTALLAVSQIDNDEELLIANGDILIKSNLQAIIDSFRKRNLDGGIVTFESVHPRWSYVKVDENGYVFEAAEKRPISKHATTGFYWYKEGSCFVRSIKNMIRKDVRTNNKFYICPAFNEMILEQKKVGIYEIKREDYISLSSIHDIEQFEKSLPRKRKTEI